MAAAVHSFCNYSNHSLHKTSHRGTKYLLEVCALSVHAFLHWCCLLVQSYSSSKFRVGIFGMFHIPTAILMLATSFFISSFPGAYQEVQPVRFVQSGQRSECTLKWMSRLHFLRKHLRQMVHMWGLSPVCTLMWLSRWHFLAKSFLQTVQM